MKRYMQGALDETSRLGQRKNVSAPISLILLRDCRRRSRPRTYSLDFGYLPW